MRSVSTVFISIAGLSSFLKTNNDIFIKDKSSKCFMPCFENGRKELKQTVKKRNSNCLFSSSYQLLSSSSSESKRSLKGLI